MPPHSVAWGTTKRVAPGPVGESYTHRDSYKPLLMNRFRVFPLIGVSDSFTTIRLAYEPRFFCLIRICLFQSPITYVISMAYCLPPRGWSRSLEDWHGNRLTEDERQARAAW